MLLLWLCRWRWRSVPERRGAATARLFLPSVHCETVTGAKMADNREEISELVEKRGIYRHLSVAIPSRRDDSTSLSRECCRGDASSPLIIATRHATLIAAAARLPATERRAWPKHVDELFARKLLSRTRGICKIHRIRSSRKLSRDARRLGNVAPSIRDGCHCRRSFALAVAVPYQTWPNAPTFDSARSRDRGNTWIIIELEVETARLITH